MSKTSCAPPSPDSLDLAASHDIHLQHAFRQVGLKVHSLLTSGEKKMYQYQYRLTKLDYCRNHRYRYSSTGKRAET